MPEYSYAQKLRFVEELTVTPDNAFAACMKVFADTSLALEASRILPLDKEVVALQAEQNGQPASADLIPTREDIARKLWGIASERTNQGRYAYGAEDRIKALSKLAEVMDYMPRKDAVDVKVNLQNNVMIVPTQSDWGNAARAQQAKLINDAAE